MPATSFCTGSDEAHEPSLERQPAAHREAR